MPRGGKRPGAGRPKGSRDKKTRKDAKRLVADGNTTPLDVMIEAMRFYQAQGDRDKAAAFAKDAAPYLHAKLSSPTVSGPSGGPLQVTEVGVTNRDDAKRLLALLSEATPLPGLNGAGTRICGRSGLRQDDGGNLGSPEESQS